MSKNSQTNVQPKRTQRPPRGSKLMAKPPQPVKDREISNAELELYKRRFGQM
jgi:hypothetical protein